MKWLRVPFRRQFRLLSFGVILTIISIFFSFTPYHCQIVLSITPSREACFSDLLWGFLAFPASLVVLVLGILRAILLN